jgi:hypothetical protein
VQQVLSACKNVIRWSRPVLFLYVSNFPPLISLITREGNIDSTELSVRRFGCRQGSDHACAWQSHYESSLGGICQHCPTKVEQAMLPSLFTLLKNSSVVPNLIELLGTLLGRSSRTTREVGGGPGGLLAVEWIKEILNSVC